MDPVHALLILNHLPGLGAIRLRKILDTFENAENALAQPYESLLDAGFSKTIAQVVSNWKDYAKLWETDLELVEKHQVTLLPYFDPLFPKAYQQLRDSPCLLYVKGDLKTLQHPLPIAVVGTRNPTIYGQEIAKPLIEELAQRGACIISGLARGIDTIAHIAAIRGNSSTIAIIGSGLHHIYPIENKQLANKICDHGIIMSEFPMNMAPSKHYFPQRNRLVSGISKGILLIEGALDSGAMITMQKGIEQGKRLFAIPGRIDVPSFKANHLLIKQGQASLVETANDLLSNFEDLFSFLPKVPPRLEKSAIALSSEESDFLMKMPNEETTFEALLHITSVDTQQLNSLLMSLQLKKQISIFPGGVYKKKPSLLH